MKNTDIFVVIPAFNEGCVIASTLRPLIGLGYSIVVVDDGSQDNTEEILEGLPIYFLRHRINLGQGAALQTGMEFSLMKGARVIVHFDADGQHSVKDLEALLRPVIENQVDVVLGSRFLRKSDQIRIPSWRRSILTCAVIFNGLVTGIWLSDAHNGFRVFSKCAAEKICIRESGYAHASEILNEIKRAHLSYMEKATRIRYTKYSRQKGQSLWNSFNIVVDLMMRRVFK